MWNYLFRDFYHETFFFVKYSIIEKHERNNFNATAGMNAGA